tara:strand:+ start:479 stop:1027 length:549 start_codon:yes stop_codon:yes gene_type:complete
MLLNSNRANIGTKAHDFKLLNINSKFYTLENIKKKNGFVLAFICNHCPYVKDMINRLVSDFNYLLSIDVGIVTIMPNDYLSYPEDSFENMKKFSNINNFSFPYLIDSDQIIAKKFGAICTPDFYCFDKKDKLFYRGRLDNVKYRSNYEKREKSLINAFLKIIKNNSLVTNQKSSIGCSIKWK